MTFWSAVSFAVGAVIVALLGELARSAVYLSFIAGGAIALLCTRIANRR